MDLVLIFSVVSVKQTCKILSSREHFGLGRLKFSFLAPPLPLRRGLGGEGALRIRNCPPLNEFSGAHEVGVRGHSPTNELGLELIRLMQDPIRRQDLNGKTSAAPSGLRTLLIGLDPYAKRTLSPQTPNLPKGEGEPEKPIRVWLRPVRAAL
jgi:hypothetical protein